MMDALENGTPQHSASAKRAFCAMWIGGTVGAFLTALLQNALSHIHEVSWQPDSHVTFDRLIRYGYMLWFLWYFIISNANRERETDPHRKDIVFAVIQSLAALVAAFFLGFSRGPGVKPEPFVCAMTIANAAIVIISGLSLRMFNNVPPTEINTHRWVGFVVSGISLTVPLMHVSDGARFALFGVFLLILFATILSYTFRRTKIQRSEIAAAKATAEAATQTAEAVWKEKWNSDWSDAGPKECAALDQCMDWIKVRDLKKALQSAQKQLGLTQNSPPPVA